MLTMLMLLKTWVPYQVLQLQHSSKDSTPFDPRILSICPRSFPSFELHDLERLDVRPSWL